MTRLPGVGGSLFPGGFLAAVASENWRNGMPTLELESRRRKFVSWWHRVEMCCGPATGLRALFDLVAMPLASLLGFRAKDAEFENGRVRVRLHADERQLDMVIVPWASRPSGLWRDLSISQQTGEPFCLLLAPPFVSVVDLRGHSMRRSADFVMPAVLDTRSFAAFWTACAADSTLHVLVQASSSFQDGVREDLECGVVAALATMCPAIRLAQTQNASSAFSEALTIVYRILFLLFAESRDLVPRLNPAFGQAYTVTGLCRRVLEAPDEPRGLWEGLAAITRLSRLGCDTGDLILRPFNGRLFSRASAPALETTTRTPRPGRNCRLRDAALARSIVALATRPGRAGREEISYADLGVEQLGAVYERVLDLDAQAIADAAPPQTKQGSLGSRHHSHVRKDTGTFYTPQALAEFVVRRTLAPLVTGASSDQILDLRVVDPAMGSGAFLVAACRYLSAAYEQALVDEGRCSEGDLDSEMRTHIRRTVAGRCLAGVDANPVAVQLARLSLWLTTLAKDRPLSFLDHQLRVGDSLVGTTPDDLWREPRGNRRLHHASRGLPFQPVELESALRDIVRPLRILRHGHDDRVSDVKERERLFATISADRSPIAAWRAACDLWCARWFWPDGQSPSPAETRAAIAMLVTRDQMLNSRTLRQWLDTTREVARKTTFFHWPLEFADVFYDTTGAARSRPGFDAVIGNPPWDLVRHDRAAFVSFVRESGMYRSCDRGRLNLYQPFVEQAVRLTRIGGRVGLVLPWSFATDDGAAGLREMLFNVTSMDTLVGLDNARGIFPIHRGLRIAVVAATAGGRTSEIRARFGVRSPEEIDALPAVDAPPDDSRDAIRLTVDTIRRAGGPTLRIPDVRRSADLNRLRRLTRVLPPLGSDEGWHVRFGRELNATEDRQRLGNEGLPVIEGKQISPCRVVVPNDCLRIEPGEALRALPDRRYESPRLAYRDVSGVGNRYALIAAVIPGGVVTTHTLFCLKTRLALERQFFLCGLFNSREMNTIVRMLMGSHVTTSLVEQLPVPIWTGAEDQIQISRLAQALAESNEAPDSPAHASLIAELDRTVTALYDRAIG
jgi:Eco57I restriction-modification methylase